jgi:hypothetical protein
MSPAGRSAFASTHWMVNRIHGNTSNLWSPAEPTLTACFTQRYILMHHIPKLANGGLTI